MMPRQTGAAAAAAAGKTSASVDATAATGVMAKRYLFKGLTREGLEGRSSSVGVNSTALASMRPMRPQLDQSLTHVRGQVGPIEPATLRCLAQAGGRQAVEHAPWQVPEHRVAERTLARGG